MKSIGAAMREVAEGFPPLGAVELPLLDAVGCALGRDLVSDQELPAWDNSAMDGYAVRHAELEPGRALPLQGESRAGGAWPDALQAGHAMRIFTGAPLPAGADTVVIQENAQRGAGGVRFEPLPERGANVRRRASDLARGSVALRAGQAIGAGEVALLAALGQARVSVRRRPRVAILSTGDELRELGAPLRPGSVVNSNAYSLATQVRHAGAEPWILPIAGDRAEAIADGLRQALEADVVVSTGGVSAGDHDRVREALALAGAEVRFWKVAIKPGKPLLFARVGQVPVVGLPGNPVSAFVTFELFVRPGLRRMAGLAEPYPELIEVVLEHPHTHGTGRTEFARAALRSQDGELRARLHPRQGSGSLPSLAGLDALVVLPGEQASFPSGARLRALPVRGFLYRVDPPLV